MVQTHCDRWTEKTSLKKQVENSSCPSESNRLDKAFLLYEALQLTFEPLTTAFIDGH